MNRIVASLRPAARQVLAARVSMPVHRAIGAQQRYLSAQTFLDVNEVQERVLSVVKNFDKVDSNKVTPSSHFVNDLGLDSLDTVEVVMAFEDEFVIEIPDAEAEKIQTCKDAIDFIAAHPMAK